MYSIKVKKEIRGKLIKFLNKHKIDTRLFSTCIYNLIIKKFKFKRNQFLNAINSYDSFIDIPIWYGMKKKTQNYIIKKINEFFKMINGKKILAVIPARAGRFQLKIKILENGKTLIEIAYKCLKKIKGIDKVILSTDSKKYAKIALNLI